MNYSVVKIPVQPITKKYYEKRFASKMDERGYMHLDKKSTFGMKIIHYLDNWYPSWEIPVVESPFLKVRLPKVYMNYGIHKSKLLELSKLLDAEAMDFYIQEIACAASFPTVSVTDAIITVMAKYDVSEEDYRSDSMRRQYDRYCGDILGEPFKEFSHKINAAVKALTERMVSKIQKPVHV